MPRVTIGVVAPHTVPAVFLKPLFEVIEHTRKKVGEVSLSVNNQGFLHSARNTCAQEALSNGSDYLFFLDADIIAPANIVERLVSKEKDIIGGPCHYRVAPYPPLLYKKKGNSLEYVLETDVTEKRLYKADALGAGCLLINRRVLEKIGQPFFDLRIGEAWVGEDIYFSRKASENGFGLWFDNTIQGVKHFGAAVDSNDYRAWGELIRKGEARFNVKK